MSSSAISKPVVSNPFSMSAALAPNSKVAERLKALEAVRAMKLVDNVNRVTSVTAEVTAVVVGMHTYKIKAKEVQKVTLFMMDPSSLYTGNEDQFVEKVQNGKVVEPELKIDKSRKTLSIPISHAQNFEDKLKKRQTANPNFTDVDKYYTLKGPCAVETKIDCKLEDKVENHQIVRVSLSAFKYLLDGDEDETPAAEGEVKMVSETIGISVRVHTLKVTGAANSAALFAAFLEAPVLLGTPVPSFDEMKKLDSDVRNITAQKGKVTNVGSKIVTVPVMCGAPTLQAKLLEQDEGTLAEISFQVLGDKSPFVHETLDKSMLQKADIVLTLSSWKKEKAWRDVVVTRLWGSELEIYGCGEVGAWGKGMAKSLMMQTPMLITGQVNHTDSDALQRANTDPTVRSVLSLKAMRPIGDVPGAIRYKIGVPVSKLFAMTLTLLSKRNGQATTHPCLTITSAETQKKNIYNNSAEPVMFVLNELDPALRKQVFDDKESGYQFFAVVGDYIIAEDDNELLDQLRALQADPTYNGPLGEMLTSKKWKPSAPRDFELETYGATVPADGVVPPTHPCVAKQARTFAMGQSVYFYIYAISTVSYDKAVASKASSKLLTIESRKRERTPDTKTNGHGDSSNGAGAAGVPTDDDDEIVNPNKFGRQE